MKRILVVNVNWLGDAIMTTPALKGIKEKFPKSFLAIMAPERVKDVFSNNPYVDEFIIFDEKTTHKSLSAKLNFITQIRKKRFDTVFLIHRSFTRALICFFAGIKTRIGYKRPKNIFIINRPIMPHSKNIHKQDYYLGIFEKTEITITDKLPQVYPKSHLLEKYKNDLDGIRKKSAYVVGVNPSANWLLKRWPAENFAMLCDRLIKELNCAIILIGSKNDSGIINEVTNKMERNVYNLCGKTSITELAAIIKNTDLFISNDSGPAHLAASLGTSTLVLFGPTSSDLSAPRGEKVEILKKSIDCEIPCYKVSCQDNLCMKNITVDDAYLKAKAILERCSKT